MTFLRQIAALLVLTFSAMSATPLALALAPAEVSGMKCCKKASAHACCKRQHSSDAPAWVGVQSCSGSCACSGTVSVVSGSGVSAGRAVAEAVFVARVVRGLAPVASATFYPAFLYQRPPPR